MVATPADSPVTTPVPLMVPVVAGVTDHVPPVVASVIAAVPEIQMLLLPAMAAGDGITVTVLATVQPDPSE